jgi:ribosomal protein L11 methylase PrmA
VQNELRDHVAPGGCLVLTGILQERAVNFEANFVMTGFKILARMQLAEWVGLMLQRT